MREAVSSGELLTFLDAWIIIIIIIIIMGGLGESLGASWGPLGGLLGASWGPLGGFLGASWGLLELCLLKSLEDRLRSIKISLPQPVKSPGFFCWH